MVLHQLLLEKGPVFFGVGHPIVAGLLDVGDYPIPFRHMQSCIAVGNNYETNLQFVHFQFMNINV